MHHEENTTKEDEHFVCMGGCRGVSNMPGTCQAGDCTDYGQPLKECTCGDNRHNNFEPQE